MKDEGIRVLKNAVGLRGFSSGSSPRNCGGQRLLRGPLLPLPPWRDNHYLNVSRRARKDREELLDVFGRQRPRLRDDILGRAAVCAQGP
jgi:hypothetical protein